MNFCIVNLFGCDRSSPLWSLWMAMAREEWPSALNAQLLIKWGFISVWFFGGFFRGFYTETGAIIYENVKK